MESVQYFNFRDGSGDSRGNATLAAGPVNGESSSTRGECLPGRLAKRRQENEDDDQGEEEESDRLHNKQTTLIGMPLHTNAKAILMSIFLERPLPENLVGFAS
eukprot:6173742-Pleurochrysis_carterae.AAC.1